MLSHYGSHAGLRIARKHIGWYSKGLPQSSEFRAAVNNVEDAATGVAPEANPLAVAIVDACATSR